VLPLCGCATTNLAELGILDEAPSKTGATRRHGPEAAETGVPLIAAEEVQPARFLRSPADTQLARTRRDASPVRAGYAYPKGTGTLDGVSTMTSIPATLPMVARVRPFAALQSPAGTGLRPNSSDPSSGNVDQARGIPHLAGVQQAAYLDPATTLQTTSTLQPATALQTTSTFQPALLYGDPAPGASATEASVTGASATGSSATGASAIMNPAPGTKLLTSAIADSGFDTRGDSDSDSGAGTAFRASRLLEAARPSPGALLQPEEISTVRAGSRFTASEETPLGRPSGLASGSSTMGGAQSSLFVEEIHRAALTPMARDARVRRLPLVPRSVE
jgi:hypothetical protein